MWGVQALGYKKRGSNVAVQAKGVQEKGFKRWGLRVAVQAWWFKRGEVSSVGF